MNLKCLKALKVYLAYVTSWSDTEVKREALFYKIMQKPRIRDALPL